MSTVRLTPHFTLSELACHDGTPVPDMCLANARAICERAEVLRAAIGSPLIVVSGYRTPAYNKRIGGAARSQHMTASALDLVSRVVPAAELRLLYLKLIGEGQVPDGGVGEYPNFVHIDIGKARRWAGGHGR
jgi:uncharacterized protein YcbK (DUF882 family)